MDLFRFPKFDSRSSLFIIEEDDFLGLKYSLFFSFFPNLSAKGILSS